MPVLSNPKHELFAQELAKGASADQAYVLAGYKEHRSNAARLSANEHIRSRVEEILSLAAHKAGVTVERIVNELAKIAFANSADYFAWSSEGVRIIPSDELTRDQLAAVSEVQETQAKGHGENTIKIKLSDKQGALEKLGRHLGMFKDRVEHSGPNGGPIKTEETSARDLLAGKLAKIAPKPEM